MEGIMILSPTQVDAYKREGFIGTIDVIDEPQITSYRRAFDDLEARVDKETAQIGLIDHHFEEKFIWELATHPTILDSIEKLIGPNVFLLATHFFNKYGEGDQAEVFVAWHQDVTFWGLEPPMAITAWYAVDDSDEENGCMQVIPGTHVSGVVEHGKAQQAGNLLSINQEVHVSPEQAASAVDLPLHAGQVSIHDGTLIHGSLPNRSDRRRCGLTLRYVPTSVRQAEENSLDGRWKPVLVRGKDEENNFGEWKTPWQ
jgi:ectoine hydroxylase-related dioxygenase (phytanoyl-CoA dioxygenase family)